MPFNKEQVGAAARWAVTTAGAYIVTKWGFGDAPTWAAVAGVVGTFASFGWSMFTHA